MVQILGLRSVPLLKGSGFRNKLVFVLAVDLLLASCADSPQGFSGGPIVSLIDSVVLQEPDSAVVGRFANVTHDRFGRTYLADLTGGRVVRFNRDGTFSGTIGRSGAGPGELQAAGQPGLLSNDSILAVPDPKAATVSLFEAGTGRFLRRNRMSFLDAGRSWTEVGDTVVVGLQFAAGIVARWRWVDSGATIVGAIPARLAKAGPLPLRYGKIDAVPFPNGYVVLLPLDPGLQLLDRKGKPLGRVILPRRVRRGNDEGLLAKQVAREAQGRPFEYLGSMAAGLSRLSSGHFAVLMLDVDAARDGSGAEPTGARYYLVVVDSDFRKACVDGLVPLVSDAPLPFPGFVHDTLVALARQVAPGNTVRSVVYRYGVSLSRCRWLETGGVRPPDP